MNLNAIVIALTLLSTIALHSPIAQATDLTTTDLTTTDLTITDLTTTDNPVAIDLPQPEDFLPKDLLPEDPLPEDFQPIDYGIELPQPGEDVSIDPEWLYQTSGEPGTIDDMPEKPQPIEETQTDQPPQPIPSNHPPLYRPWILDSIKRNPTSNPQLTNTQSVPEPGAIAAMLTLTGLLLSRRKSNPS